jgi:hypothetical protein
MIPYLSVALRIEKHATLHAFKIAKKKTKNVIFHSLSHRPFAQKYPVILLEKYSLMA